VRKIPLHKAEEKMRDKSIDDDKKKKAQQCKVFTRTKRDIDVGMSRKGTQKDARKTAKKNPSIQANHKQGYRMKNSVR
jgi:hypothetical protein